MSVTDHLMRDLAPIPPQAWREIDDEARQRLTPLLAARKVVDWAGAQGWQRDARSTGRTRDLPALPADMSGDVRLRQRVVLPLVEVRVPFTVSRREIEDAERGARDLEFGNLDSAARQIAEVENRAVFHGWADAGIVGMVEASPYPAGELGADCAAYPGIIARAVDVLRCAGIQGPYALAVGPDTYTRIVETTEHGGYPLVEHLGRILDGAVHWAPGVDGAVLLSVRGGDFELEVGQDLSVGYLHSDTDTVQLYLEESLTFQVLEPDATVAMT